MLFALSAPAEMLLLHMLIPWTLLKYLVLAVELYGLVWLAAIGVSFGFLRHHVSPTEVRLRQGLLADIRIPVSSRVASRLEPMMSANARTNIAIDADTAELPVEGRTHVIFELSEPVRIHRLFGFSPPVTRIRFAVDDPKSFLAALPSTGTVNLPGDRFDASSPVVERRTSPRGMKPASVAGRRVSS